MIGLLLFLSTVVNVIDRQTLSVLAPILKREYRWTNSNFATVRDLGGTAAGLGTLISTYLIGVVADSGSFKPVIVSASIIPLVAVILMTSLVRSSNKPDPFRLLRSF